MVACVYTGRVGAGGVGMVDCSEGGVGGGVGGCIGGSEGNVH